MLQYEGKALCSMLLLQLLCLREIYRSLHICTRYMHTCTQADTAMLYFNNSKCHRRRLAAPDTHMAESRYKEGNCLGKAVCIVPLAGAQIQVLTSAHTRTIEGRASPTTKPPKLLLPNCCAHALSAALSQMLSDKEQQLKGSTSRLHPSEDKAQSFATFKQQHMDKVLCVLMLEAERVCTPVHVPGWHHICTRMTTSVHKPYTVLVGRPS